MSSGPKHHVQRSDRALSDAAFLRVQSSRQPAWQRFLSDNRQPRLSINVKPRSHAVTFRLEEREYENLLKTVNAQGARSVSEFTRSAVMRDVTATLSKRYNFVDVVTLDRRLEAFMLALGDLRTYVQQFLREANGPLDPK